MSDWKTISCDVLVIGGGIGGLSCATAIKEHNPEADVLVVAGTSLAVWPAAGFIDYFSGHALIVANMTPTSADAKADLVIRDPVGQAFDW